MKGRTDIVSAVHHLKLADMHMLSFMKERESAALTRMFRAYRIKLDWIFKDLTSDPTMPQIVRDGINQELNSDILSVPAINDKVALLTPSKRELVEFIIDKLLEGEDIKVEGMNV